MTNPVRVAQGPWPLALQRVIATVSVTCPRCAAEEDRDVLAGADWWDVEGLALQRGLALGLTCSTCGGAIDLPVPLVQHRDLDGIELIIALPMTTSADVDRLWLREIIGLLRDQISSPRVVTVRATWFDAIAALPLGPVLTGLSPLPEVPAPAEDSASWLADTRNALGVPDIAAALSRFVSAPTVAEARNIVEAEPSLGDLAWRCSVEVAGHRILEIQETPEQRQVVEQRLSRLRQIAVNHDVDARGDEVGPATQQALDAAIAVSPADPTRVGLLEAAVETLRAGGHRRTLAAALTSLLAAQLASPDRSPSRWDELVALAEEAQRASAEAFGSDHEATVINELNWLLLRQERPHASAQEIADACRDYEQLIQAPAVRRTGHLVDALTNLATAVDLRTDLSRGERQEMTIALFETVEHIARLVQPHDLRTATLALTNQASLLRQRLAGSRLRNLEHALAQLTEAEQIADAHQTLYPAERVQVLTNKLNLTFSLYTLTRRPELRAGLEELVQQALEAVAILNPDNEIAITTALNTGSVLIETHVDDLQTGHAGAALAQAEELLGSTRDRCLRLFPPGHRTRLTALMNLAAVYGAPTAQGVLDAAQAEALYRQVAQEGSGRALDHVATAMSNLGGLLVGLGAWEAGASAYARARHARARLIEQTSGRHTHLGEVVATGDLAAREALALVRLHRIDDAVASLEAGRASLLRRHRGMVTPTAAPHVARRAVVHIASSGLGTIAIVQANGRPGEAILGSMTSAELRAVVTPVLVARNRFERMLAFDHMQASLREFVGAIGTLVPEDTTEICLVVGGPLAGAPLHALTGPDGTTFLDRWTVRYWASSTVAAHTPPPDLTTVRRAIAVTGEPTDLPLADAEIDVLRRTFPLVSTPPEGWSVAAWLRGELSHSQVAHFACHARVDVTDPAGARFEVSPDEAITIDDLLDGPHLKDLELVVASACQSGAPVPDAPDEFLGIAYGLVHAGARGAITSLWDVNDLPAALLVARLYRELASGAHPAEALRVAQRWLATADSSELLRQCHGADGRESWLPPAISETLREHLSSAPPADRPFRHGSDWAAFTYLGS